MRPKLTILLIFLYEKSNKVRYGHLLPIPQHLPGSLITFLVNFPKYSNYLLWLQAIPLPISHINVTIPCYPDEHLLIDHGIQIKYQSLYTSHYPIGLPATINKIRPFKQ
jgi:hypothetical protein